MADVLAAEQVEWGELEVEVEVEVERSRCFRRHLAVDVPFFPSRSGLYHLLVYPEQRAGILHNICMSNYIISLTDLILNRCNLFWFTCPRLRWREGLSVTKRIDLPANTNT